MNREIFAEKVLESEKSLYYVAKSILYNDEDCADAVQNAILKAYSHLDSLREEQYFKTWITRILINECYQMVKKNKLRVPYEEYMQEQPGNGGKVYAETYSEAYSEVYMEIQRLEEKYRVPFVLHYVEGFSLKEISRMLKASEASIKMRLLRARNILKERL